MPRVRTIRNWCTSFGLLRLVAGLPIDCTFANEISPRARSSPFFARRTRALTRATQYPSQRSTNPRGPDRASIRSRQSVPVVSVEGWVDRILNLTGTAPTRSRSRSESGVALVILLPLTKVPFLLPKSSSTA